MKVRLLLVVMVLALVASSFAYVGAATKNVLVLAKSDQYDFLKKVCKADAGIKFTLAITAYPPAEEPNLTDEGLKGFDAVILGELVSGEGTNGAKMLTADQMNAIKKRVEAGGNFFMFGGWCSFQGGSGGGWAGQWGGTPIAEIAPVNIGPDWDNNDNPGTIVLDLPNDPIVAGLDWAKAPQVGGHNKLSAKTGATVIAHVKEDNLPLIVTGKFGQGKTLAYASTFGGWDKEISKWADYEKFWYQMIKFVAQ
jgi:uncharacterized membrane protein